MKNVGRRIVDGRLFLSVAGVWSMMGYASAQSTVPLRITPMEPGCYLLDWQAQEQKTHMLEGSRDLVTWKGISRVVEGSGNARSLLFEGSESTYFFRLREGAIRPGFNAVELPPNDDYSSNARLLPFVVNFLGTDYGACYVNNNGNITFGDNLSVFTPEDLRTINAQILAPFWADVDTRAEGSGVIHFSKSHDAAGFVQEYVDGHRAFGATYSEVGHFDLHPDKLNSFQIVIIEREDTGARNFDVEFNYNRIEWEAGDVDGEDGYGGLSARAGIAGRGPKPANQKFAMEVEGSGVPGAFLDKIRSSGAENTGSGLVHRTWNSDVPGRLRFEFRNGALFGAMRVNAGADVTLPYGASGSIQLQGEVFLAGVGGYTALWTQTGGATAQIANAASLTPNVTLPEAGSYVFRLTTTTKTKPRFSSYDEIIVTLEDEILTVHAGSPIELEGNAPYTVTLAGSAGFTGGGQLTLAWSQSGGETAQVSNPAILNPQVTLPGPGAYEFTLTATTDGSPPRVGSSTVTVTHSAP
ncbi:hypothetical protein JIN84_14585 [Luteolibacter yonseiensis]|uniref:NIDO domain-containing protein n=1 Tax=Luteolibacter yonseiensis TaxID=1144680 RepID=A0A934VCU2_9BACT|nr:nidogen-like domain-containing protein [Luteolibacter yonseiensis]MBK1816849.1 hypothetical protein [Luteolibacter yonseiensis]